MSHVAQGFLTLDDVTAFLDKHVVTPDHKFDYNCDLFKRFFGTTARKRVRVQEFSQFFNMLQNEIAVQAFFNFDPQGRTTTTTTTTTTTMVVVVAAAPPADAIITNV